ncbi:diacylglycerol O-acyltransferase 1-like [Osmerus mordax]|uniref:diacylglycerol O-acyltransferase 1-like n=1 Tax=Osmerus mordax TaxID=8014 RepID=UPI00350EA7E2
MSGIDHPQISSSPSPPETEDDEAHLFYHSNTSCDPDISEHHSAMDMLCCHSVQDSLLSSSSCFTNYRGILNWIIILLILTHAHLFLENFIQHGFLIDLRKVLEHLMQDNYNWPSVNLILAANMFAITALLLERRLQKGGLSSSTGHWLHLANLGLLALFPSLVILYDSSISTGGAFFSLWSYITLGLKLYSYQETNRWYRQEHVICSDLYYFLLAPTLCYQREFPSTPGVRINILLHRLMEMVLLAQIMVGIVQQWVTPLFQQSENYFSNMDLTGQVGMLVGLVAPTHFLWLLFFFLFTHSYLNFCAELLCFGDRKFYGDWWNAQTLASFWRNWILPFEKWKNRHLYTPLLRHKVSPKQAELLVFLLAAALCEYMVALPLHNCRLWIFLTMVFELLVSVCLGRYFRGNYGNGMVWLCLLLGPPLAVMTYFHDNYVSHHHYHHHHHHVGQCRPGLPAAFTT